MRVALSHQELSSQEFKGDLVTIGEPVGIEQFRHEGLEFHRQRLQRIGFSYQPRHVIRGRNPNASFFVPFRMDEVDFLHRNNPHSGAGPSLWDRTIPRKPESPLPPRPLSSVAIIKADDIVLAEVAPRLDLDDLQRFGADVFHAVLGAERDVGRLVGLKVKHLITTGDAGAPGNHDPMLRTVVVQLQRDRGTRLHDDPFDLISRTLLDAVVTTPGAVDLTVQRMFRTP